MRVDFRRAHTGMPKHLLYGKQVGTDFKQVGGKAMPKRVWADDFVDAVFFGEFFHDEEDHLTGEACASTVQKDRVSEFGFGCDVQPRSLDVLEEDFQAAVADGHEPFLAAFADDAEKAIVTVDVADLQPDEF